MVRGPRLWAHRHLATASSKQPGPLPPRPIFDPTVLESIAGVYCTPLNPWDYFQRLHVESTPMFIAYPKTVSEKGTVPFSSQGTGKSGQSPDGSR